jgi:hypothetical protein
MYVCMREEIPIFGTSCSTPSPTAQLKPYVCTAQLSSKSPIITDYLRSKKGLKTRVSPPKSRAYGSHTRGNLRDTWNLRGICVRLGKESDMHRKIVVLCSGQHRTCEGLIGRGKEATIGAVPGEINNHTAVGMNDNQNMNKAGRRRIRKLTSI